MSGALWDGFRAERGCGAPVGAMRGCTKGDVETHTRRVRWVGGVGIFKGISLNTYSSKVIEHSDQLS